MNNFKKHLITEEIKALHAAKLYDYVEKYHDEILVLLKSRLETKWNKLLKEFNKIYKPDFEYLEKINLMNADTSLFKVSSSTSNIHSTRFSNSKISNCNFYISLAINDSDRKIIRKQILAASKEVLEQLISEFTKIFHIEKTSGELHSLFKVNLHDDEVKLKFISNFKNETTMKTIFLIGIDHGKRNSKTKIFDKVFFIDMIK